LILFCEGVFTEKIADKNRRTLSHEHTIFRERDFFQIACGADVVGNRRGQKNNTHTHCEGGIREIEGVPGGQAERSIDDRFRGGGGPPKVGVFSEFGYP